MYLSSSGRDLVYLLEGILRGELAAEKSAPPLDALAVDDAARWEALDHQRRLLLERLDVLDQTDQELMQRFTDLQRAMKCTTPELEHFWKKVWTQ